MNVRPTCSRYTRTPAPPVWKPRRLNVASEGEMPKRRWRIFPTGRTIALRPRVSKRIGAIRDGARRSAALKLRARLRAGAEAKESAPAGRSGPAVDLVFVGGRVTEGWRVRVRHGVTILQLY